MYMHVYVRIRRMRYFLHMYMIVSVCIVSVCIVCICTYVSVRTHVYVYEKFLSVRLQLDTGRAQRGLKAGVKVQV
jgi:hypothetical protein